MKIAKVLENLWRGLVGDFYRVTAWEYDGKEKRAAVDVKFSSRSAAETEARKLSKIYDRVSVLKNAPTAPHGWVRRTYGR